MAGASQPPSFGAPAPFQGTERYEVVRKIGEGGMGVVYEAVDRLRGRHVALKTLNRFDADGIYRIKQEFRSLIDVSHPNLVQLHELVAEEEAWFFTMELVQGQDLLRWLHGERPPRPEEPSLPPPSSAGWSVRSGAHIALPIGDEEETEAGPEGAPRSVVPDPEVAEVAQTPKGQLFSSVRELELERLAPAMGQLVEAVAALHEMGRLHRDIKPTNALVTETGRVVLLDFGLVTPMYDRQLVRSTVQGMVCGTVAYMSPEQGAGDALTPASDWYSVGVILYEALTGKLPFTGTMFRVLMDKQQFEPPSPRELVKDVPEHLDQLCRALLSKSPEDRPTASQILEALGRDVHVDLTPSVAFPIDLPGHFVGRAAELEQMQVSLRRATAGQAQVVLVEGRSGVGKSALIKRFLDQVAVDGSTVVLSGRCHERELMPFKGIDGMVDALSRYLRRLPIDEVQALLPQDAPLLARLFPILGRVEALAALPDPTRGSGATQELRRRAFDALRVLLDRVARRTPLILSLDDLQWGDADSGELLSHLLAPPEPPPLLVLGSYRIEDRDQSPLLSVISALEEAPRGLGVVRLNVGTLGPVEAEGLATALIREADKKASDDEVRTRARLVAAESGGDPLFVYELAQRDAEGKDYARPVSAADATPQRRLRLEEVLFERIKALPLGAQRLLEVVAMAAAPTRIVVANEAAGISSAEDREVDLLKAQRLLRSSLAGEDYIEVYHDRVRETLHKRVTPEIARAHHLALARILEAQESPDPVALVRHLVEAGATTRASRYARSAAQAAFSVMAFERAAALYGMALDLAAAESERRWQIEAWRAESLASAGRAVPAAKAYLRASEACGGDQGFELRRRAAEQYLGSGHADQGLDILRELLTQVGLPYPGSAAEAMKAAAAGRGRFTLGTVKFEAKSSREVPRRVKQQIDVCWSLATGLAMVDFVRGAYFASRMLSLALNAGDPMRAVRAMSVEGVILGGMERSEERAAKMQRLLERTADGVARPNAKGLMRMSRGFAAYLRGRWRLAEQEMEAALHIFTTQCTGVAWESNTCRVIRAEAISNQGRIREVGESMRRALAQAAAVDNRYVSATYRTFPYLSVVWLAVDEAERARRELDGVEGDQEDGFRLRDYSRMVSLTNVDLYEGNGAEAWRRVQATWPALEGSMILRMRLLGAEALFLRARAALAAAEVTASGLSKVRRELNDTGKSLEALGLPHVPGFVALIKAQRSLLRGRRDRAREIFAEARRTFEAVDMSLHAAVAGRREGELVGGGEGRFMVERADRFLVEQGIVRPDKMARLFCPVSGTTVGL